MSLFNILISFWFPFVLFVLVYLHKYFEFRKNTLTTSLYGHFTKYQQKHTQCSTPKSKSESDLQWVTPFDCLLRNWQLTLIELILYFVTENAQNICGFDKILVNFFCRFYSKAFLQFIIEPMKSRILFLLNELSPLMHFSKSNKSAKIWNFNIESLMSP